MQKIKGLIAAAFTPMNADFSVKYYSIEGQARHLMKNGVVGALICGSTGEGHSLSVEERKQIAEVWKENVRDDFHLFVHVGHNAIPEAKTLALHASKLGVSGILLSAPNYFKPTTVEDLASFCAACVEGVDDVPVYYYHIPSMSGVNFPMRLFLEAASEKIPNFRGIKYTYEDLHDLNQCIQLKDGAYELIFGRDEILLDALKLGITSALGSTYNYTAPLFNEILSAYHSGDIDKASYLQQEATKIIDVIIQFGGGIVAGKAVMGMIGLECGPSEVAASNA